MTQPAPTDYQDVLDKDVDDVSLKELVQALSWSAEEIQQNSRKIKELVQQFCDHHSTKVVVKQAAKDFRDILSKLEEVNQYIIE